MDIKPENADTFQHKEWLASSMTQQLLKRLNEFRELCISSSSVFLFQGDAPERVIFANLACVRNLDTVKELITNTEKFLNKPNKPIENQE